jgi:hypothetical protein
VISLSPRWWFYSISLIFAVAASVWVTVRGPKTVIAAAPITREAFIQTPRRAVAAPSILEIPIREFPEPALTEQTRDPFNTALADAPPPPIAALPTPVPHPSPPTVPPLPFSYRGMLTDDEGQWIVQLARGHEFLLAGPGDLIDSTYRLDNLENDELTFTYLPMSAAQALSISSAQP